MNQRNRNIMTYHETLDFLYSQLPAYHRIGKAAYKADLNNTIILDNHFGNPHLKFRTIHVAGTNGKGSVSHMISSVLQGSGYKTGLYTSPHIRDLRERIRVNGSMIGENDVISFVQNNRDIISSLQPSFFEMAVAMALDFFAREKVDVAVIEVGLGGRLDSTNIITPVLSVITNIGYDHMELLGESLEKIAYEKAGIIKNEVPVVISETQDEIKEVFITRAYESGSEIFFADSRFRCRLEDYDTSTAERKYIIADNFSGSAREGSVPLCGDYQANNIQAVYQAFSTLDDLFPVPESNVVNGIKNVIINTGFSGRWQILNQMPLTICDTGHNREGLTYVVGQLNRIPKSALRIVLGFVNDKDISSILPLFPRDAFYYFTRASVPRALDENILKTRAEAFGLSGNCFPDVKAAIKAAADDASGDDLIFIGGSTFVVADALQEM
jgi:dihydrofolate synthase / folylpolyglutamate synthase